MGKYSVMVIGRDWFSVYLVKCVQGREVIYNLIPLLHVSHKEFSFNGPRKPEEAADTDVI